MASNKYISDLIQFHNGIEYFNYDLVVDWAIELIESGIETDNILILASFSKPVEALEIKDYVSAVLNDLDIEERVGDIAVFALIKYYLSEILEDNSIRDNLSLLYNLFLEKEGFNKEDIFGLSPFYFLHHAWIELDDIGINCYFDGADLDKKYMDEETKTLP